MRARLAVTVIAACVVLAPRASAAVHLTPIGVFDTPVYVTAPPGDPHRLFVVEQAGRIMEVRDGQPLATPFLDIRSDVVSGGEQGLLSMAFAPDYATSRKFYVYYTAPAASGSTITIQELQTAPDDPDAVDLATRRTLVTIPHPDNANHNGGQLQFGPDGALYAGTGDGGSGNDPPNNAQTPASNLGKLLRVDTTTGALTQHAMGLRNPWRFSFDRQTGDLVIADVGQDAWEEIDFEPAGTPDGLNYGWRCFEGFQRTSNPCSVTTGMTPPVLVQPHPDFCAIVGGYVVRDPALTGLTGRYVYGDNCNSDIRSVVLAAGSATGDQATGLTVDGLTSFGEDSCGHVYTASGLGQVKRIDGDTFTPCPEAQAPGGGGGPSGTPPPDTRAPVLKLSVRHRQRVLRRHGVHLTARCDETCGLSVHARVMIQRARKQYKILALTRQLAAGRTKKLTLHFTKGSRRAVAKALRRHRRVVILVTAVARDASGNSRHSGRGVRAVR